jgi:glycosyltransferase involved in cell wall biosynthesis
LRQTLESLMHQSAGPDRFEVIIGDDGSTDGTVDLLQRLDPPYKLRWARLDGRGSGAARNAAARLARGEVLIFLDDDQVAAPDLVAVHLESHARHDGVIVQGDFPIAAGLDRVGTSIIYERARLATFSSMEASLRPGHLWSANFSIRRSTWDRLGGFDENLPRCQDLDFGLRVTESGVPMLVERRALSRHLHHVSTAGFRRQCFNEGRCMVRIAGKHGVPVAALLGGSVDRPLDRLVKRFWVRSPGWAAAMGRGASGLLWAADRVRVRPVQLLASRLLRRFHELGGIALETASPLSSQAIA